MIRTNTNTIIREVVAIEWGQYPEDGIVPTTDNLRQWMPHCDTSKLLPFMPPAPILGTPDARDKGMLYAGDILQQMPRDQEPDDWQSKVHYRVTRCKLQHTLDVPTKTRQVEVTRTFPGTEIEYEQDVLETEILNPEEMKPHRVADIATIAVLNGWNNEPKLQVFRDSHGISSLEDGIIAIHNLWKVIENNHRGDFKHPIASILPIRECAADDCNAVFCLKHRFYTTGGKRKFCSKRCGNRMAKRRERSLS